MRLQLVVALAAMSIGVAHADQNLLDGGNFSSGPVPPWTDVDLGDYSLITNDGVPAPSVEMITSTSGSSGQGLYQCVAATAGVSYRLTINVKRVGANQTSVTGVGIAVAFYGAPFCGIGSPIGGAAAIADPDSLAVGVWASLGSGQIVAPAGTQFALVGVGANDANADVYTFKADAAFFGPDEAIFADGFDND